MCDFVYPVEKSYFTSRERAFLELERSIKTSPSFVIIFEYLMAIAPTYLFGVKVKGTRAALKYLRFPDF